MKKCCFIIPYFGKLPDYFGVFLKTCTRNSDFNWLIFSDCVINYDIPDNVKIIKQSFEEFKKIIEEKIKVKVNIKSYHKLCDFKPAYGLIYEEYLKDFKSWGHCDIDIILGNLNKFITDDMIDKYDKIFCLGHMIIYKNTYDNNRMFMKKYNGKELYKEIFSSEKTFIFDETFGGKDNINSIFEEYGKKIYTKDLAFNAKIFPTKFVRTQFDYSKYDFVDESYKKAIYIWNNGDLYRLFLNEKKLVKEEFIYFHFQQRNMQINYNIMKSNFFKIIPNKFDVLETIDITEKNFNKIKKNKLCMHYYSKHLEWYISKIKRGVKHDK